MIDVRIFQEPQKIGVSREAKPINSASTIKETIVVAAREEGFQRAFLGENGWYAIRISGGRLNEIKYIAAYQVTPISAVTHVAEIESIEPYGDKGKYRVNFLSPAQQIDHLRYEVGDSPPQSPRYTNYKRFFNAKNLTGLFE